MAIGTHHAFVVAREQFVHKATKQDVDLNIACSLRNSISLHLDLGAFFAD